MVILKPQADVLHICVVDTNDASIVEMIRGCIRILFMPSSQHHYVVMVGIGVKSVLTTVEIVCGIIDVKDVVLVDTTTLEQHLVEGGLWCIVAAVKAQQGTTSTQFCNVQMDWPDARVEVVFQLCSKWGTKYIHTAMAGSSGFWLIKRLRTIGLCWDFPML